MAVQNIVPVGDLPTLANEVITVTTSEPNNTLVQVITDNGVNLNVCNTHELNTSEMEKKSDMQNSQLLATAITSTPPKIMQSSGQFVQVKPPPTSGRVQSPNVKNFFIRKGIEKQIVTSPAGTFITTQGITSPQMTISQLPSNKKIIIKSQQILVPANNMKQNPGQIIQMSSGQSNISTSQATIPMKSNVLETSSDDLTGILDLPILFADNNDGPMIDQTTRILNTSAPSTQFLNTSGSTTQIINTSIPSTQIHNTSLPSNVLITTTSDRNIASPSNIFFTTADGKLPNRPVVISAAKVTKPMQQTTISTTPSSNKVIFINRNQIKQQIVGTQSGTPIVNRLQALKFVPTSLSSTTQSTPITLHGNQLTKLTPGTKIDLSTLKLMKNTSSNVSGTIVKPLIINKTMAGTKNAIVIKSPMRTNLQNHSAVIKGNVLNRNITVKKVMNVVPVMKQMTNSPVVITSMNSSSPVVISSVTSSPIQSSQSPSQSPIQSQSPSPSQKMNMSKTIVSMSNTSPSNNSTQKSTRKTRNSN